MKRIKIEEGIIPAKARFRVATAGIHLIQPLLLSIALFLLLVLPAYPHAINYEVKQKGISVRVFYTEKDPASYSEYELFGPGDSQPHQTGRSDKNGFISFFPERPGVWKIKVWGESSHGYHGVTLDVKVDEALDLKSFSKPLAATHTKLIVGISLIIGFFGVYALLKSRKIQDDRKKSQFEKEELK
jgi:nickel transport protein